MKAIVTGGCGFIGSNLVKALIARGDTVSVIDDLSSGSVLNKEPGVEYYYFSIADDGVANEIIMNQQPDVIFHLAAIPRVAYSVEFPKETAFNNIMGTICLLDAVRNFCPKCRVVSASSSSIYGGDAEMPTKESSKFSPKSPYALEKVNLEQWVKMYADLYGLDLVSLRYFNVFGPGSLFGGAYSTVLSAWLYSVYVDTTSKPFLESDGLQSRDFCNIENVVQANLSAAARTEKFAGEAINIAQGKSYTLLTVKSIIETISGKELVLEQRPERVGDVKHTLADISLAKQMLSYDPTSDFERQVGVMAEWYKTSYPRSLVGQ